MVACGSTSMAPTCEPPKVVQEILQQSEPCHEHRIIKTQQPILLFSKAAAI